MKEIKPAIYGDVRSRIYNGDLLLFRPSVPDGEVGDTTSEAIAAGGRSVYSHAAMAARWFNVMMCIGMGYGGGEAVPLSDLVNKHPGHWDVYETNAIRKFSFNRGMLIDTMIRTTSAPYGWSNFFRLCASKLPFVRWFVKTPTKDCCDSEGWVCSESFARACRIAGYDPVPNLADRATEPGDLARSPFFKYKFTLFPTKKTLDNFIATQADKQEECNE